MRLKIWLSKDGWRVSLVFSNGRIFATSEAYSSHAKALDAAYNAHQELLTFEVNDSEWQRSHPA